MRDNLRYLATKSLFAQGEQAEHRQAGTEQNPGLASIYRALAEQAKREAHPEAIEQAHAEFTADQTRA